MNLRKYLNPIESYTRKNAPTILSSIGMIGVITTAIVAVKDSKKADNIIKRRNDYKLNKYGEDLTTTEKIISAAPAYLPTMISGVTTLSCIYGANHINKNRQAMLIGAYGYLNNCFTEYKDAVNEIYGEESNDRVENHIIQTKVNDTDLITDLRDDEIIIYEEYSDMYIKTTRNKIDIAIAHINRHYITFGALSVNNFLDFLDVEEVPHGDMYGWSCYKNDELGVDAWIDVTIINIDDVNNQKIYKVIWNIEPSTDYIEWHLL